MYFKTISGEAASVNENVVSVWREKLYDVKLVKKKTFITAVKRDVIF